MRQPHHSKSAQGVYTTLKLLALVLCLHHSTALLAKVPLSQKIQIRKQFRNLSEVKELDEQSKGRYIASQREEAISQIRAVLARTRDKDKAISLSLRLAKLYAEAANAKTAGYTLDHAIQLLDHLEKIAQNHPDLPSWMMLAADYAKEAGRNDEAIQRFLRLVAKFGNSLPLIEARTHLADRYFDAREFKKAEELYDMVISYDRFPERIYAVYRKAWCHHNTGRISSSLELFKQAIDLERGKHLPKYRTQIRQDIAIPLSAPLYLSQALEYLPTLGEPYSERALDKVAQTLLEHAQYREATQVFSYLKDRYSSTIEYPRYIMSYIRALDQVGSKEEALKVYRSEHPKLLSDSKSFPSAPNTLETLASETISYYSGTRNNPLHKDMSIKWLNTYVELFPKSTKNHSMYSLLGRILLEDKQFALSAEAFLAAIKRSPPPDLHYQYLNLALVALDREMRWDKKSKKFAVYQVEGESLSRSETIFLEVAKDYLSTYKNDENLPDLLFELGVLYYRHKDGKKANEHLSLLILRYPDHEASLSAVPLLLDILNEEKNYQRMVELCEGLLANKKFVDASQRKKILDIEFRSELQLIRQAEEKKDYLEAAQGYIAFVKKHEANCSDLCEKALYNASVNFEKAGNHQGTIASGERFLSSYSNSSLKMGTIKRLTESYLQEASFAKARQFSMTLAENSSNAEEMEEYLKVATLVGEGQDPSTSIEKILKQKRLSKEKELLLLGQLTALTTGKSHLNHNKRGLFLARAMGVSKLKSPALLETYAKMLRVEISLTESLFHQQKLSSRNFDSALPIKLHLLSSIEKGYAELAKIPDPSLVVEGLAQTSIAYRSLVEELEQVFPTEKDAIAKLRTTALRLSDRCLEVAAKREVVDVSVARCKQTQMALNGKNSRTLSSHPFKPAIADFKGDEKTQSLLEAGGFKQAKALLIWESMKNIDPGAIENNLGVVAYQEQQEKEAARHWWKSYHLHKNEQALKNLQQLSKTYDLGDIVSFSSSN